MNDKMKINIDLFLTFFRIGFFTFGGGLAMISVIEVEIVNKKAYLSEEEFVNTVAIVQSLPGVIAVNMASAVGRKINGVLGAIASYIGVVLPSFMIIYLIARFFTPYMSNEYVFAFFKGLKPAVVVLILFSVTRMGKVAIRDRQSIVIAMFALFLLVLNVDPVLIILLSGVVGILLLRGKNDEYNE